MQEALKAIEKGSIKKQVADIRVGDTIRVHQKIKEGKKERVQVFEGLVISYKKTGSVGAFVTVRKVASGVGVEKSWFVNSPNVVKIQIIKRSKVKRAVLSYMRARSGKSARMTEQDFDRNTANEADDRTESQIAEEEQTKIAKAEEVKANEDELNQVEESTDDVAKEENKEAKESEATNDEAPKDKTEDEKVNTDGQDEALAPAEEFQEGVDRKQK
jgi:large subunit ribosomal protein L19